MSLWGSRRENTGVALFSMPFRSPIAFIGVENSPAQGQRSHYEPWCENWVNEKGHCYLQWNPEQVKCYYLYHLLLHELGHIIDCHNTAKSRRESFAENFALHWARQFGIIERLA